MSKIKFLVTGGAGFIGSNIVEDLLKRGHKVRVLDNFSTGKRENINEFINDIELIEGDIRSYHIVKGAVKGVEVVLHQAALPSIPRSIKDPITTNEVNVNGIINILESSVAEGVGRVVYASSSSVYGDNPELPKREDMIPNPLSPYAVSKLASEKYCSVFSKIYGIDTVILRYFNVFGPRQDPSSQYSAVIPRFIKAIKNDEQPVIYGDGKQSRDFTYIANVVNANILAASENCNSGIVLNCACHEQTSLNKLISLLNKNLNKNIEPIYENPRPGDIKHSLASIDLARKEINYTPNISFEEGLKHTVRGYDSM